MKTIKTILFCLSFCLSVSLISSAQTNIHNGAPADSTRVPTIPPYVLESSINNTIWTTEFTLSISILMFGLIVVFLEVYLASKKAISPNQIWKCLIITLVIISSLVLITAGYSNNQISGISGILGSIAGYLLAKSGSLDEKS